MRRQPSICSYPPTCVCVCVIIIPLQQRQQSTEWSHPQRLPAVMLCGGMNDAPRFYFYQMSAPFFIFYLIFGGRWKKRKRKGGCQERQGNFMYMAHFTSKLNVLYIKIYTAKSNMHSTVQTVLINIQENATITKKYTKQQPPTQRQRRTPHLPCRQRNPQMHTDTHTYGN